MHRVGHLLGWGFPVLLAALAAGCSSLPPERGISRAVAPAPGRAWQPPSDATPPLPAAGQGPQIPAEYLKEGAALSLSQIVDLALRNNPATRQAWFDARAAAAELGAKYSAWYPSLELDAQIQRQKQAAVGGQFTFLQRRSPPRPLCRGLRPQRGDPGRRASRGERVLPVLERQGAARGCGGEPQAGS